MSSVSPAMDGNLEVLDIFGTLFDETVMPSIELFQFKYSRAMRFPHNVKDWQGFTNMSLFFFYALSYSNLQMLSVCIPCIPDLDYLNFEFHLSTLLIATQHLKTLR